VICSNSYFRSKSFITQSDWGVQQWAASQANNFPSRQLEAVMTKSAAPRKPRASKSAAALARNGTSGAEFPVVGIGCSAGGLEAMENFLAHAPADSGMAFVVVQHLAPQHPSALPELLQRHTAMRVLEAGDGMAIEPDCVYVIPPNNDLSLHQGQLHLAAPIAAHGLRLPIDFFLRSLAEDRKEQAIGVILSGMGSDGVFGLRAIKEKAGLTLVQEPASAQADAMPRSAIEAGVADIIVPPEAIRLAASGA
jgi:chemotaxis response regulator CheB